MQALLLFLSNLPNLILSYLVQSYLFLEIVSAVDAAKEKVYAKVVNKRNTLLFVTYILSIE